MELIDKSKVINITAETGVLETQSRVQDMQAVISIPDNATNGDIIRALFPDAEVKFYINLSGMRTVDVDFKDKEYNKIYTKHTFTHDWWDTPYKVESGDTE